MLHETQLAFRDAVLGSGNAALASQFEASAIDPARRLLIHRHHLFMTLTEALATTFPVVRRLVDRRFFAHLAHRYIEASPPSQPCLFEYGASFAGFIADFPACRTLPYLPDVARLEWAINCAYHADDAPILTAAALDAQPPAVLATKTFAFHPSVRIVGSRFPIDAIWRANQHGGDPDARVDIDRGGAVILIHRRDLDVEWRRLSESEHRFVAWLGGGRSLVEACHAAEALGPFDLAATLAMLLSAGVFRAASQD